MASIKDIARCRDLCGSWDHLQKVWTSHNVKTKMNEFVQLRIEYAGGKKILNCPYFLESITRGNPFLK